MRTGFLIDGIDVGDVPSTPTTPPTRAELRAQRRAERRADARAARARADKRNQDRYEKSKDRGLPYGFNTSIGVLKILLFTLLIVNFFRALRGDADYFSFARFFDVLQHAPTVPIDWISTFSWHLDPSILGDWSFAFNWLRDAIIGVANFFSTSLTTGLYISTGIGNFVIFVGYFVSKLFY